MKTRLLFLTLILTGFLWANPAVAENEERDVPSFSEISLRIPAKLHLEQGPKQSVEIKAKSSVMEDIITEVKGRTLTIRFPGKNFFMRDFNPGEIEIYITVPEIDALSISGSGDIISEGTIKTRILDLAVSGSGDIKLDDLNSERVKAVVSGSGDIFIAGDKQAEDLSIVISGSGDVNAEDFAATDVNVKITGSGDCTVTANGSLYARIAGSGGVKYKGNPSIDTSVVGSGSVQKL